MLAGISEISLIVWDFFIYTLHLSLFSKHFMIFPFYQNNTYYFRNIILIKYIYFVKIFLGATTR